VDWELKGSDPFIFTKAGDATMCDTKTVIGRYSGGMLLVTTSSAISALAEPSGPVELPTDMGVLDLLREEVLDTVLLDRSVHFLTPRQRTSSSRCPPVNRPWRRFPI
jgi:hypothetical protein